MTAGSREIFYANETVSKAGTCGGANSRAMSCECVTVPDVNIFRKWHLHAMKQREANPSIGLGVPMASWWWSTNLI